MNDMEMRYAELVVTRQLQLRSGEALSINSETETIGFARLLANLATTLTNEPVQIVETEKGRIKQVYPIDPKVPEVLRPKVSGMAMCHIVDLGAAPYYSENEPKELAKDVVTLGHYGLLAEPLELDRRLAVPWANVPYPGAMWGMDHLGEDVTEGEMWRLFASLFRLDSQSPDSYWAEQANMLEYRKRKLNERKQGNLVIRGDGWMMTMKIADATQWHGGEETVQGNRKFFTSLPAQHLEATIDNESGEGSFASTRPFLLLGKEVTGARFSIHKGKAIAWSAEQGMEALDAFFSIDEGARSVSELSLADENTRESRVLKKDNHPLFNKCATSHIGFGGFSMETLERHVSEEELERLHLNQSLVRLDVPIGSPTLEVSVENGEERFLLMEEGVITEEEQDD